MLAFRRHRWQPSARSRSQRTARLCHARGMLTTCCWTSLVVRVRQSAPVSQKALWTKSALRSGVHHCAHRQSAARLPVRHAHCSPRCCLRGAGPPLPLTLAASCSHHRRVAACVRAARQAKGHGRAGQCGRDEGTRYMPHAIERAALCAAYSLGGPAVVPEMAASARAFAGMHDVVGRELRVTVVVGWR
jgi:hypothetical protein